LSQNEHKVRKYFETAVQKLKDESYDQTMRSSTFGSSSQNELTRLNGHYKFIRQVSTYSGLPEKSQPK